MKRAFQTLAIGVFVGVFLVGCSSASSGNDSPPSYTTASDTEKAAITAANDYINDAASEVLDQEDQGNTSGSTTLPGVTFSGSYENGDVFNLTITFENYEDTNENVISGTLTIKGTSNGTNKATVHQLGNFVITAGPNSGTFGCDVTTTTTYNSSSNTLRFTESGSFTVNGKKYSYSYDSGEQSLNLSAASSHVPFSFLRK